MVDCRTVDLTDNWQFCARFMSKELFQVLRVSGQPVTDADLLADLRHVAGLLHSPTVSRPAYREHGRYGATTLNSRFGSWNKALVAAGLSISHEINIPDGRLFENLLILWKYRGRQPRRTELSSPPSPPSTISQGPYNRRFSSWTAALHAFVIYANSSDFDSPDQLTTASIPKHRTTGRDPSLRLRWKVLLRDRFTCCSCGRSPAKSLGVELHVDHVNPWSNGGETVPDNLQTLCFDCNLGKSDERSTQPCAVVNCSA